MEATWPNKQLLRGQWIQRDLSQGKLESDEFCPPPDPHVLTPPWVRDHTLPATHVIVIDALKSCKNYGQWNDRFIWPIEQVILHWKYCWVSNGILGGAKYGTSVLDTWTSNSAVEISSGHFGRDQYYIPQNYGRTFEIKKWDTFPWDRPAPERCPYFRDRSLLYCTIGNTGKHPCRGVAFQWGEVPLCMCISWPVQSGHLSLL